MVINLRKEEKPKGWEICSLTDFAHIEMGQSPPSSTYNHEGVGLPFFQGKAEFTELYPKIDKYCSQPNKIAKAGATLLTVRAPVGPTNLAKVDCCIGRGLAGIHPLFEIEPNFILLLMRSIEHDISSKGTGSTFTAINKTFLEELAFALPPLAEQKRIVAKIEELFSELDKGIESLKTARVQLKIYRQSVLKHAFEGKLTRQWREDNEDKLEPADELLERIKQERETYYQNQLDEWQTAVKTWEQNGKEGKKPKKPKKPKESSLVNENPWVSLPKLPSEWGWLELSSVAQHITDGDHQAPPQAKSGVPFIVISNIKNGKIDFNSTKYVPEKYYHEISDDRKPKYRDVLYTVTGSFGIPSIIDFNKNFCFQRHIGLIRPMSSINSKFIFYVLLNPLTFRQAQKVATGTAQKTVPLSGLRVFSIPIMSIDEQKILISEIESRLSAIDCVEHEIETNLQKAEALRQSILKKAFSGKLVAQDSNDEPASVLLERIKAEKEKNKKSKKGRAA